MGLSIWNLFKAGLLIVNAIMILHRKRFLSKFGLHDLNNMQGNGGGGGPDNNALQANMVGLLHAVQYLRVPVIAANTITIVFELIFGS